MSALTFQGETDHSRFYTCHSGRHGPALLKVLSETGRRNEAGGFEVLSQYAPADSVRLYEFDQTSAVMEVLKGPRLLELIDEGQADAALDIQLRLTDRLVATRAQIAGLKSLKDIMQDSLAMEVESIPGWARDVIPSAQALCRDLLSDQSGWTPLHGDLHPRNIMQHQGTWRAIDARGICGPIAFEYANAFINPWDRKALIFKDGRMEALAENISRRLSVSADAIVGCAIANALYYAHLSFQKGQGRHPTRCIRQLMDLVRRP